MTRIYHITHLDNLRSILERGELCCDQTRVEADIRARNIGYTHIKERRKNRVITKGPGGKLWEYTPFYFAPRSPMLYTIDRGNVPGYSEGQTPVVHLVATVEKVVDSGLGFVFTDGHAEIDISRQFDDLADLHRIDWKIMGERYWHDTPEDNDRLRRRQAEFLVHRALPWHLVDRVGVISDEIAAAVRTVVGPTPPVIVRPDWYY